MTITDDDGGLEESTNEDSTLSGSFPYELLVLDEWSEESASTSDMVSPPSGQIENYEGQNNPLKICISNDGLFLAILFKHDIEIRLFRDMFTSVSTHIVFRCQQQQQQEGVEGDSEGAMSGCVECCLCWNDCRVNSDNRWLAMACHCSQRLAVFSGIASDSDTWVASSNPLPAEISTASANYRILNLMHVQESNCLLALLSCSYLVVYNLNSKRVILSQLTLNGSPLVRVFCGVLVPSANLPPLLLTSGRDLRLFGCRHLQGTASCGGLLAWQLDLTADPEQLSPTPWLSAVEKNTLKATGVSLSVLRQAVKRSWLHSWLGENQVDVIAALAVSPAGTRATASHRSGGLSLWQLYPSLRQLSYWPVEAQPGHGAVSPVLLQLPTERRVQLVQRHEMLSRRVEAVDWWSGRAVVVARANGAVAVCGIGSDCHTLTSVLGEAVEFFGERPLVVVSAETSTILILERELVCGQCGGGGGEGEVSVCHCSSSPDPVHSRVSDGRSMRVLIRSALHWLTDWEQFEPQPKRRRHHRCPSSTSSSDLSTAAMAKHRLSCLRRTTPEQLLLRRLEMGEYGEALALARRFRLNTDPVYLRQWRSAPVTRHSIDTYLARVQCCQTVVDECCRRLAPLADDMAALLSHGIQITSTAPECVGGENGRARLQLLAKSRRKLLTYRRQLHLYSQLRGVCELYTAEQYDQLRSLQPLQLAVQLARAGDWRRLLKLLKLRPQLQPYWLQLLWQLPLTLSPIVYAPLLQLDNIANGIDCDGDNDCDYDDWSISVDCDEDESGIADVPCTDSPLNSTAEAPLLHAPPEAPLLHAPPTVDQMLVWAEARAQYIATHSSLVEHAVQLLEVLGQQLGVPLGQGAGGGSSCFHRLRSMYVLVHELHCVHLQWSAFSRLSSLRVLALLAQDMTADNAGDLLETRLKRHLLELPVSESCSLFAQWLCEMSASTGDEGIEMVECVLRHVVTSSLSGESQSTMLPFCSSMESACDLITDCVSACRSTSSAALSALHRLCHLVTSSSRHHRLASLSLRVTAVGVLTDHGIGVSMQQMNEMNECTGKRLLRRLSDSAVSRCREVPGSWMQAWNAVKSVSPAINVSSTTPNEDSHRCRVIFLSALLAAGDKRLIELAVRLMLPEPSALAASHDHLSASCLALDSWRDCAELLASAAAEYLDAAAGVNDSRQLQLCRYVLKQAELLPAVRLESCWLREHTLLQSVVCLAELGVDIVPLQLRLCEDRSRFVLRQCVAAAGSRILQHRGRLELLSRLLEVPEPWRVQLMIGERAIQLGDVDVCVEVCRKLSAERRSCVWQLCSKLAAESHVSIEYRLEAVSLALTHCPSRYLSSLLCLQQKLKEQMCNVGECSVQNRSARNILAKSTSSLITLSLRGDELEPEHPISNPNSHSSLTECCALPPFYTRTSPSGLYSNETLRAGETSTLKALTSAVTRFISESGRDPAGDLSPVDTAAGDMIPVAVESDWHLAAACTKCVCDNTLYCALSTDIADLSATFMAALRLAAPIELQTRHLPVKMTTTDTGRISQLLKKRLRSAERRWLLGCLATLSDNNMEQIDKFTAKTTTTRYRRELLLNTVNNDDNSALCVAIRLTTVYRMTHAARFRRRLAWAHLVHLLASEGVSQDEVRHRLISHPLLARVIVRQSRQLRKLLHQLVKTAGSNYSKLQLYLELLSNICDGESSEQEAILRQTELLLLLEKSESGVGLWSVISADDLSLMTLVNDDNVERLMAISEHLQRFRQSDSATLTPACVLSAWIKCGWQRYLNLSPESPQQLLQRLERLLLSHHLSPSQFEQCAESVLFSQEAVDCPLQWRHFASEILTTCVQRLLQPSTTVNGSLGDSSTVDTDTNQESSRVLDKLSQWREHLEYLEWDSYGDLLADNDACVRYLARCFDLSRGEPVLLQRLPVEAMASGCSARALQMLLAVMPLDQQVTVPEAVSAAIKWGVEECMSVSESSSVCSSVSSLAQAVVDCLKADLVSAHQLWQMFDSACTDYNSSHAHTISCRKRVDVAEQLAGDEADQRRILAACWPELLIRDSQKLLEQLMPGEKLDTEVINTESARLELLHRLSGATSSPTDLAHLVHLVWRIWPDFEPAVYTSPDTNPLLLVCRRAWQLQLPEKLLQLVAEHSNTWRLDTQCHWLVVKMVRETPNRWQLGVRLALLSEDPGLNSAAVEFSIEALDSGCEWPLEDQWLGEFLQARLLPLMVDSPLFEPVLRLLLKGPPEGVDEAVNLLRGAGCQLEAARLLMEARANQQVQPPDLTTAAKHAASKVLSKLLK